MYSVEDIDMHIISRLEKGREKDKEDMSRPAPSADPPPATGAGVLLSLWAIACVLMLLVAVTDDRAPGWADGQSAAPEHQDAVHSAVYSPSFAAVEAPWESTTSTGTISLVETLPVGDFNVTATAPGTFDALYARVQAATTSIDMSAMYWCVLNLFDCSGYV
jgi:hypothetical protein